MAVIAMTREMGSRGKDIALGLADALGLSIIHSEVVEHEIASKLHTDDRAVHRYLEGRRRIRDRWNLKETAVASQTAAQVYEIADKGNVIIRGWGASFLLREVPHVLCLRVCAPMDSRARTLMERFGLEDESLARRRIEENDAAHDRVLRRIGEGDWRDPLFYDLVINTGRIAVDDGVALVEHVLRQPSFYETSVSRNRLRELKIRAQLRTVLQGDATLFHDSFGIETAVDPITGMVTLSGVTTNKQLPARAELAIAELPGVGHIQNRITVVRPEYRD